MFCVSAGRDALHRLRSSEVDGGSAAERRGVLDEDDTVRRSVGLAGALRA